MNLTTINNLLHKQIMLGEYGFNLLGLLLTLSLMAIVLIVLMFINNTKWINGG